MNWWMDGTSFIETTGMPDATPYRRVMRAIVSDAKIKHLIVMRIDPLIEGW